MAVNSPGPCLDVLKSPPGQFGYGSGSRSEGGQVPVIKPSHVLPAQIHGPIETVIREIIDEMGVVTGDQWKFFPESVILSVNTKGSRSRDLD